MPFYIMTVVQQVDHHGKPVSESPSAHSVKELNVWDDRTVEALRAAYSADGSISTIRVAPQHSPGRPLEWRGDLAVFAPHLISIEVDVKANAKQSRGPVAYLERVRSADEPSARR